MHMTKLRSVGGSVMFAIPKPILEGLGLSPNMNVGISVENGHLIVEPYPKPRYTLSELVAQCDMSARAAKEDKAWDSNMPQGREEI